MDYSQKKIIVIDDEQAIRESIEAFLLDYDFIVETADSAEEGLELIKNNDYDAAVVDLRLPGMSGDTMILKAYKFKPSLIFIIHTGSVDFTITDDLIKIGVFEDQILLKPLSDMSLLVDKINHLFKTKS